MGLLILVLAVGMGGCAWEMDRIYALPLDHPPTEEDWDRAVGVRLQASGGRTSQAAESDVDRDGVHTSTASCHHGTQAPPVQVDVRAFHTDEHLFLRVEWADPTEDRGPLWTWDGVQWVAGGFREDGLGILWGSPGQVFLCSRACHLEDWRVAGPRAFADYRMAAPAGSDALDLWVWKAGRGTDEGSAEDVTLGPDGVTGDAGERETYVANSRNARAGTGTPFGPDDAPWEAPDPEPGARVPGFLPGTAAGGTHEVRARSEWRRGVWRVTLSRSLEGGNRHDVLLLPGAELSFGLALLDGVEKDHNAVPVPIRVRLVKREELRSTTGDGKE